MEPTNTRLPESGTIADTVIRLARWGSLAPDGLARVEFVSEYARQHVVDGLREIFQETDTAFHEIELPVNTPAEQIVRDLVARFRSLGPGVVSLTGFETAFPDNVALVDSLRILNFNRENLALHPLRQIWWMTPAFAQTFIQSVPDLDSWFIVRLNISEVALPSARFAFSSILPITDPISRQEAKKRSAYLLGRFETALSKGASAKHLLDLSTVAVDALYQAGDERGAWELLQSLFQKMQTAGVDITAYLENDTLHKDLDDARILNNLAGLYYAQKRFAEAGHLQERSAAITEQLLGPEHPYTAISLNNLADFYSSQGRFTEAEALYRRALAIREKAFGSQHPDVAQSLNSLANLYHQQNRYIEAEMLYKQALAIFEQVLGPSHPYTATCYNNLAALYVDEGRMVEAEPMLRRALEAVETSLGPNSEKTLSARSDYIELLHRFGRVREAQALERHYAP